MLGNVRFSQTEEQHEESQLSFFEYDDLNRLLIVEEADFSDPVHAIEDDPSNPGRTPIGIDGEPGVATDAKGGAPRPASVPTDSELDLGRLTDIISPDTFHNNEYFTLLTSNRTLWNYTSSIIPDFWTTWEGMDTVSRDCADLTQAFPEAVGPFIVHEAATWTPTTEISTYTDFEDIGEHPENVRVAIHYDDLPSSYSPVWAHFPPIEDWKVLAPGDTIRNLRGREAAVAYREHGGQPYHFTVMSYDERGRPEALLRYTENLGFEAIHYEYNSMNKLIRVTAADPLRRHTTWYGYDYNGRLDSVWTAVDTVGSGTLLHGQPNNWDFQDYAQSGPIDPVITYSYTPTGKVDTMFYPQIDVATWYNYTPRKWLDMLVATNCLVKLFCQELTCDDVRDISIMAPGSNE